ncbi:hypothetical protein IF1G_11159 [Cordyceps javanica]|uniref:Uncharacterized protein n=1 Tax=Cordyceps javanica TaxID=43265 RepID=A0A545VI28_9HYPO|nr:hypothetical protein IF1G_11159 [Cordyceps javanica]TQW01385.1 hypothetical protein IF2G_11095 [Cordyceps javanica]
MERIPTLRKHLGTRGEPHELLGPAEGLSPTVSKGPNSGISPKPNCREQPIVRGNLRQEGCHPPCLTLTYPARTTSSSYSLPNDEFCGSASNDLPLEKAGLTARPSAPQPSPQHRPVSSATRVGTHERMLPAHHHRNDHGGRTPHNESYRRQGGTSTDGQNNKYTASRRLDRGER